MVEAAQFGVSMPGGAEALVHTRETIEAAIIPDAAHGVWATGYVDFQHAFPTLRYGAIDTAVGARVPELQPWSRWCQDHCGVVFLPSGGKYRARRGAEQGDPLASMQCGCVIADIVASASQANILIAPASGMPTMGSTLVGLATLTFFFVVSIARQLLLASLAAQDGMSNLLSGS